MFDWAAEVKQYEADKAQFSTPPRDHRVTYQEMKTKETQYHPILQTYTHPEMERAVIHMEKHGLVESLAKNKDRALRYEQTFNIINLDDKLKGLEDKPGYPKAKPINYNKRNANSTNANYNILSNLHSSEHSHLPPDKRIAPEKEEFKTKKVATTGLRNYNILNNRYFENHDEKMEIDQNFYKQEAASKFWKTNDFHPVKIAYVDPEKEVGFQALRTTMAKTHGKDQIDKLPNGIKYSESALYQPINGTVVDEGRLNEIDRKNKLAKQRYEARYEIENEYRKLDIEEQERAKLQTLNRLNHNRYIESRQRGYNIVSQQPFEGRYAEKLYEPQTKPAPSIWEKAVAAARDPPPTAPVEVRTLRPRRASAGSGPGSHSVGPTTPNAITFINQGRIDPNPRHVATPPAPSIQSGRASIRSSGFRRS